MVRSAGDHGAIEVIEATTNRQLHAVEVMGR